MRALGEGADSGGGALPQWTATPERHFPLRLNNWSFRFTESSRAQAAWVSLPL